MNNIKRLTKSLLVISAVFLIVAGVSAAFFLNLGKSTGDTYAANDIDLMVGNESYYNGEAVPALSWVDTTSILDGKLFFNFTDLKPDDEGEDTISLTVDAEDAWACMKVELLSNDDLSSNEPELTAGDTPDDPLDSWDGELADYLEFLWWADDGDNVYETGETLLSDGVKTLTDLATTSGPFLVSLSDSISVNPWTGVLGDPLSADTTYHVGKAWCFGTLTETPLAQDNVGDVRTPIGVEGPGVLCNGEGVENTLQTDGVTLDASFFAYQVQHHSDYVCFQYEVEEPTVIEGEADIDEGSGVHYRSFQNSQGSDSPDEIYLGADTGNNPKRNEQDIDWLIDGSNSFSFIYTTTTDQLLTTVNTNPTLTYEDISVDALCPVGDWDVLQLSMKGEQNDTVDITDFTVNGVLLGDFAGSASEQFWTISGFDLSDGVTVTGNIVITAPVTNNGDGNNVKIYVGCSN